MTGATAAQTPRGRGRPALTPEQQEQARDRIVAATRRVFADVGERGLSVARILSEAGIARPTFYRYFNNALEPLQIMLDAVGAASVAELTAAVDAAPSGPAKVLASIEAHLSWSMEHRDVLPGLWAGLHDSASPVSGMRRRTLDTMIEMIEREIAVDGRPMPPRWVLDVFATSLEFTCYRLHLDTRVTPDDVQVARQTMIRIATAMLGARRDWQFIAGVPEMFDD